MLDTRQASLYISSSRRVGGMATQRIANASHAGSNPVRASNLKLKRRSFDRLFYFVLFHFHSKRETAHRSETMRETSERSQ